MPSRTDRRRSRGLILGVEPCEGRLLLTQNLLLRQAAAPITAELSPREIRAIQLRKPAFHPIRQNTPVLPYARPAAGGTFADPTVAFVQPRRIEIGVRNYIAPYAALDARGGFIKVGSASSIQDHALIRANPTGRRGIPGVLIGDSVYLGARSVVRGPATIGTLSKTALPPTSIGAGATIDGATIRPGAIVSELAYVGPGVTVPADVVVLPGKAVTTDAEASDPALGKVAIQTAAQRSAAAAVLAGARGLARGYIILYQGDPATGVSPGTALYQPTIFNGSLAPVLGISPEPAVPVAAAVAPSFAVPSVNRLVQQTLPQFGSRVVGRAAFAANFFEVKAALGGRNSIRADGAQAFRFADAPRTGTGVVVNGPAGGSLAVGRGFRAGDRAVILAGKGSTIGDDVTVGAGAVVTNSSLGTGVVVGDGALVSASTLAPGTVIPARAVVVGGRVVGTVER